MEVRKPMKKKVLFVLVVSITLTICFTGCFIKKTGLEEVELGERYDSDKISKSEDGLSIGEDGLAKLFDKYSKTASETQFVVHENTAIAIAEAVMRDLYPDDNYGVVHLPINFRPLYYKVEDCWEVQLHKNGLDTSIKFSERNYDDVMLVFVDVNTGAVKAIIPSVEFSIHYSENIDN
jgi:hypothetical protein